MELYERIWLPMIISCIKVKQLKMAVNTWSTEKLINPHVWLNFSRFLLIQHRCLRYRLTIRINRVWPVSGRIRSTVVWQGAGGRSADQVLPSSLLAGTGARLAHGTAPERRRKKMPRSPWKRKLLDETIENRQFTARIWQQGLTTARLAIARSRCFGAVFRKNGSPKTPNCRRCLANCRGWYPGPKTASRGTTSPKLCPLTSSSPCWPILPYLFRQVSFAAFLLFS